MRGATFMIFSVRKSVLEQGGNCISAPHILQNSDTRVLYKENNA